jgi:Sec-independent protein secretion pathway component TatC
MIQRKQTLFLLLAALLALSTWLFPIATYQTPGEVYKLMTHGFYTLDDVLVPDASPKVPFSIILSILGAALIFAIFMYGNRKRQMRFVRGTYLLILGAIAFMFISDNSIQAYLGTDAQVEHSYGLSFIMPLIALILTFLADRAIKADEELVRSMDRLR